MGFNLAFKGLNIFCLLFRFSVAIVRLVRHAADWYALLYGSAATSQNVIVRHILYPGNRQCPASYSKKLYEYIFIWTC